VVFQAELEPSRMNRFDCRFQVLARKPLPGLRAEGGAIRFRTDNLQVDINTRTGLVDRLQVEGRDLLRSNAFRPVVLEDSDDSWEMRKKYFTDVVGVFSLLSPEAGSRFSGLGGKQVESVRVIEDGPVRTVVEAVLGYGDSAVVLTYRLPKKGTEIELGLRVFWSEKSKMLKLAIPTLFSSGSCLGQTAYGAEALPGDGREAVAQQWLVVSLEASEGHDLALSCINDGTYGCDYQNGEIRLSLIRSPGYAAHPILERPIMGDDRYSARIDQGERLFTFWINGGDREKRIDRIAREALAHNEKPLCLSFFPSGLGQRPEPLIVLEGDAVQMTAFKRAEKGRGYAIRLFEPTGRKRSATVSVPPLDLKKRVDMGPFEIKTLILDDAAKRIDEVNLLEEAP
jgi:alpha-mannosidase